MSVCLKGLCSLRAGDDSFYLVLVDDIFPTAVTLDAASCRSFVFFSFFLFVASGAVVGQSRSGGGSYRWVAISERLWKRSAFLSLGFIFLGFG